MRRKKTKEMVEIALFAAVLGILSPFTVPVPMSPVPLSLAVFAVYLSAALLGAKKSASCVLVYLLLGMAGLPVFSGFSGGMGVLLGPTGGYLIGYVPCAVAIGYMADARWLDKLLRGNRFAKNVFAMALGTLVCYTVGTVWFLVVMGGSYTPWQALLVCVAPYIIFDVVKILAAAAIAEPVKRILRNRE